MCGAPAHVRFTGQKRKSNEVRTKQTRSGALGLTLMPSSRQSSGPIQRARIKSDEARGFLLGRQSSVRCELVDDIGQLLAKATQQVFAGHTGKPCQCIDPVRAECSR